jgi:hypothetical protein
MFLKKDFLNTHPFHVPAAVILPFREITPLENSSRNCAKGVI